MQLAVPLLTRPVTAGLYYYYYYYQISLMPYLLSQFIAITASEIYVEILNLFHKNEVYNIHIFETSSYSWYL